MRARTSFVLTAGAALILAGCDAPPDTTGIPSYSASGVSATVTGGGKMLILGVFVGDFAMSNVQFDPVTGDATGRFHLSLDLGDGLIEFHGRTTCLTVDAANGRAWIGGVITKNRSIDQDWQAPRQQPGQDIWFRVVDYGEGGSASQADRSTFAGFEGDAGFDTSADYCAGKPWPGPPDDAQDARTWPLTGGDIQVRVGG